MSHRFLPTENFWERFYNLAPNQKETVRRAWELFKVKPFDSKLRPHKIHRLSAHYSGCGNRSRR